MDGPRNNRQLPVNFWARLQTVLYNPQTAAIFGRTPTNWFQLMLFYAVFYGILSMIFGVTMFGLHMTVDDNIPKNGSIIGENPGMGVRPISGTVEKNGCLIKCQLKNESTILTWVRLIDEFLVQYRDQEGKNFHRCNFTSYHRINSSEIQRTSPCIVNLDFGPCVPEKLYGYNTSSPCVFVKLNKIYSWIPQFYNTSQIGMPEDLANYIESLPDHRRSYVWVSCNGESSQDAKHLRGFRYYPNPGLPGFYYPYMNVENYLSPLISVQVLDLKPNIVVNIECRAWAQNIVYRGGVNNRQGSVRFEMIYLK